ncbi:hypothetical protein CDL12_24663 [Handroanthus impetiginosus]|uniref:Uncharacterized protein n=1 Tax=Handroanthus impetiginosus TaxID=429701 RepID=A0A2G9GBY1_9LAMI|nr:hypothetical protein CDL12_24663 [Handroanthus impetiginosus]
MPQTEKPLLGETLHPKDRQETTDEADETLSLCDLPLYSDHKQDYFEFFSQDLSPSTFRFPPENIIFCGKLIPYKQLDASEKDTSQVDESNKKQTNVKKKRRWGIFRWKFSSTRRVQSKNGKKNAALTHKKDHHISSSLHESPKKTLNKNKQGKGYGFPVHKVSMLTSSSSGKARWYLFLFGISRFSTEVELKDIKSRLSRRHCPPPPPPPPPSSPMSRRNGGSGLWGLIRVLSCGGNHHPGTMVEASSEGVFNPFKQKKSH